MIWSRSSLTVPSFGPRWWKGIRPEQLGELGLGHRPLSLRHQVDQRQASLTAGEIGFTKQLLPVLDGHFASKVDAKH
jgi:hypothetical protein